VQEPPIALIVCSTLMKKISLQGYHIERHEDQYHPVHIEKGATLEETASTSTPGSFNDLHHLWRPRCDGALERLLVTRYSEGY